MKRIISQFFLISLLIYTLISVSQSYVISRHQYEENLTVNVIGEKGNTESYKVPQGTDFSDLMEICGVSLENRYFSYGLHEPLTESETVDLSDMNKERISINEAGEEELCSLEGIGKTTAERIIAYRESREGFHYLAELENVKGIGEKKFEKIRPFICL